MKIPALALCLGFLLNGCAYSSPPETGVRSVPPELALPQNSQGRMFHLDCGPGDIAPYILTCGDPARAEKIVRLLDRVEVQRKNREFYTYTGSYKKIPISIIATGIGADNSAIVIVEASQCVSPATFIRLGSTGALQEHVAVGDLIITETALRDENTSHYYAPATVQAQAHPQVLSALKQAAATLRVPYHVGLTCTVSDFYAGTGRQPPGFTTVDPNKVERLSQAGVLNFEMEMSAYLTLTRVSSYKLRAGGVCAVFDHMLTGVLASQETMDLAEKRLIEVGLLAVEILAAKDGVGR